MKDEQHSIQTRIHAFISEQGLQEGAPLPTPEVLSKLWGCSSEAVVEAIEAAEQGGWIRRQADGSAIVLAALIHDEADKFSFTRSAHLLGKEVKTKVIAHEMVVRLPFMDHPLAQMEATAYAALGLKNPDSFTVIPRIRYLGGKPRAIHRVYLDPRRFKPTFLSDHDFCTESLVHVYESYGYTLLSRDTTLTARLPNRLEEHDLALQHPLSTPLLVAEQSLIALDPETKTPFTLEFLQGTYLHWLYRIEDRAPPKAGKQRPNSKT